MKTKMTLETIDGRYSVETKVKTGSLPELVEEVLEPLLLAAGYHPKTIKKCLPTFAEECLPTVTDE